VGIVTAGDRESISRPVVREHAPIDSVQRDDCEPRRAHHQAQVRIVFLPLNRDGICNPSSQSPLTVVARYRSSGEKLGRVAEVYAVAPRDIRGCDVNLLVDKAGGSGSRNRDGQVSLTSEKLGGSHFSLPGHSRPWRPSNRLAIPR
jgi:hypothetical protein